MSVYSDMPRKKEKKKRKKCILCLNHKHAYCLRHCVVSVDFSGSPFTSGTRHPSLCVLLSIRLCPPCCTQNWLWQKSCQHLISKCFCWSRSNWVLQSIVQLFPNVIIRILWTTRTSWLPLAVPFSLCFICFFPLFSWHHHHLNKYCGQSYSWHFIDKDI